MASPGSSIRSAARATFSAYRRIPVRWRLAGGSAALTFVILAAFAALVGVYTAGQVRGSFSNEVGASARKLAGELQLTWLPATRTVDCKNTIPDLSEYDSCSRAQIRIYAMSGKL